MKTYNRRATYSYSLLAFFLLLSAAFPLQAQRNNAPTWTTYDGRRSQYSSDVYVVGYTAEENTNNEEVNDVFDRIKDHARIQLIESIVVEIKSLTTSNTVIEDQNTVEQFRKTSVSLSKVNITGLQTDTYLDERKNTYYAICYAKRRDISESYKNTIVSNKTKVADLLSAAKADYAGGKFEQALAACYKALPLFREIEEAQTLIIAFELVNINAPSLYYSEVEQQKQGINEIINNITENKNLTLNDVCSVLANSLNSQLTNKEEVILTNITYRDSKMASTFTQRFADAMEMKLADFDIFVKRNLGTNFDITDASVNITGTYWDEDDAINVILIARNMQTGATVGSAEASVSKEHLQKRNIDYLPANYNIVSSNTNTFFADDIVSEGGLFVDITTNRGNENPIFVRGDTLKILLKANRECYVRVVYYTADNQKVLFFDNYYIAATQVNQYVKVPFEFECVEPFGIETMQLNAQTVPFSSLDYTSMGGIKFIQQETKDIVVSTRGFKPVADTDAKAEKRVIVTTMLR